MKHLNPFRGVPAYAGRGLETIPAKPRPFLIFVFRRLSGAYLKFVQGVRITDIVHGEELDRAVASERRFPLIVFRHPSADDPVLVYHLVADSLRRMRRSISRGGYPVFLYGRDVPIWGGPAVAWALPRAGAIAVFHEAINRRSMEEVYETIRTRTNPLVLAPEGQVTYRNYLSSPVQRGAAALAVDAAETRSSSPESSVLVLPAAIEYRYPDRGFRRASRVFDRILRRLGIDRKERPSRSVLVASLAERPVDWLLCAWEALFVQLLAIHKREAPRLYDELAATISQSKTGAADPHGLSMSPLRLLCGSSAGGDEPGPGRMERLSALQAAGELLLELSLRRSESGFDLAPLADPLERLFRVRQRYWERLYPPDRGTPGSVTRAIADASATESRLLSRNMQSADVLLYVDFSYLTPILGGDLIPGSANHARFAEFLLMLDDMIQRSIGYTIGERYAWPGRSCRVRFGTGIEVESSPVKKTGRRARIVALQDEIERSLSDLSGEEP